VTPVYSGTEWVVDAHGCDPAALRSPDVLGAIFARLVREVGLQPAGEPIWKVFPEPGGVTGLLLLAESHLACHTFPETGFAAFNLYCCRNRETWPWAARLQEAVGATRVEVRTLVRGDAPA
jgi:S-adenosylmethionine decarboxylase